MARADRAHARRRGLLVGRHLRRDARGAARPGDLLVGARRRPRARRHAAPGPRRRRRGAEHDGRPAPRADPPAGERRPHAAHGAPARGRAAAPRPRALLATVEDGAPVDFVIDGRGGAADADDLHPRSASPRRTATRCRRRVAPAFDVRDGRRRRRPERPRPRWPACSSTRGAHRREARRPGRRHALGRRPRRAGRRRPADAHRRRAVLVLLPALLGRLRDHPQRHRRRAARARSAPRAARTALRAEPGRAADRDRGDAALDDAVALQAPHRHARRRARRPRDRARRQGLFWEALGQPRRAGLRRPDGVRHPPRPEPAPVASATASTTASAPTWPASRCG